MHGTVRAFTLASGSQHHRLPTMPALGPPLPVKGTIMSAATTSLRRAAATLTFLFVLSPVLSIARAGEEGPPMPEPKPVCVAEVGLDTIWDVIVDLGSGVLAVVF